MVATASPERVAFSVSDDFGSGDIPTAGGGVTAFDRHQLMPAADDGETVGYLIEHETALEAEAGFGVYDSGTDTIARGTGGDLLFSTAGASNETFSTGTKRVQIGFTGADFAALRPPITNASLADMVQGTVKLRADGAGTGPPIDGTHIQLWEVLRRPVFSTSEDVHALASNQRNSITNMFPSGVVPAFQTGTLPDPAGYLDGDEFLYQVHGTGKAVTITNAGGFAVRVVDLGGNPTSVLTSSSPLWVGPSQAGQNGASFLLRRSNAVWVLIGSFRPTQTSVENVITFAATTAWDLAAIPVGQLVLTGNTTINASNIVDGRLYHLALDQDATGSRAVAWGTNFAAYMAPWSGGPNETTAYLFMATSGALHPVALQSQVPLNYESIQGASEVIDSGDNPGPFIHSRALHSDWATYKFRDPALSGSPTNPTLELPSDQCRRGAEIFAINEMAATAADVTRTGAAALGTVSVPAGWVALFRGRDNHQTNPSGASWELIYVFEDNAQKNAVTQTPWTQDIEGAGFALSGQGTVHRDRTGGAITLQHGAAPNTDLGKRVKVDGDVTIPDDMPADSLVFIENTTAVAVTFTQAAGTINGAAVDIDLLPLGKATVVVDSNPGAVPVTQIFGDIDTGRPSVLRQIATGHTIEPKDLGAILQLTAALTLTSANIGNGVIALENTSAGSVALAGFSGATALEAGKSGSIACMGATTKAVVEA